jgi:hypothetical protein
MRSLCVLLVAVCLSLSVLGCSSGSAENPRWSTRQRNDILEIGYGAGASFPQYAALHTKSSYFRMNYGPGSGWGTSVILMPSLWTGGDYFQGSKITVTSLAVDAGDLVIRFTGAIASLGVEGTIRLKPPAANSIQARVAITKVTGEVNLDDRPGERFKPVMLSSMRVSDTQWDAKSAYVGTQSYPLPAGGWVIDPPVQGTRFGLVGGTSAWKTNAPTVDILFDRSLDVTGWVTASLEPTDDNVGFWCAADQILRSWQYTISVSKATT